MLDINRWCKGKLHARCCHLPVTSAAFTAQVFAWLTAQSKLRWAPAEHVLERVNTSFLSTNLHMRVHRSKNINRNAQSNFRKYCLAKYLVVDGHSIDGVGGTVRVREILVENNHPVHVQYIFGAFFRSFFCFSLLKLRMKITFSFKLSNYQLIVPNRVEIC